MYYKLLLQGSTVSIYTTGYTSGVYLYVYNHLLQCREYDALYASFIQFDAVKVHDSDGLFQAIKLVSCVCMYRVHMYIRVCMCMYMCVYVYLCGCQCVYVYVHVLRVCVCVCVGACVRARATLLYKHFTTINSTQVIYNANCRYIISHVMLRIS